MILPKYKPNFDALTSEEAWHLAERMSLPEHTTLQGPDIYEIAKEAGLDHADVVMHLASDPSVLGVKTAEALIGKPIVRVAPPVPRQRGSGPRRTVTVRKSDPRKIVFVSPHNPKKPGSASHARFALYREGMTVQEFLEAGGTMGDVKWDAERGFVKLEGDE